jgi:hypothetical protein
MKAGPGDLGGLGLLFAASGVIQWILTERPTIQACPIETMSQRVLSDHDSITVKLMMIAGGGPAESVPGSSGPVTQHSTLIAAIVETLTWDVQSDTSHLR